MTWYGTWVAGCTAGAALTLGLCLAFGFLPWLFLAAPLVLAGGAAAMAIGRRTRKAAPRRTFVSGSSLISFDKRVSEPAIAEFRRAFERERYTWGGILPGPGQGPLLWPPADGPSVRHPAFADRQDRPANPGRCAHTDAVPVESVVTGDTLAWLCPGCDTQLPANRRAWADADGRPLNPAPRRPGAARPPNDWRTA